MNKEYHEKYARLKSDHNQVVLTSSEIVLGEAAVAISVPYWFEEHDHILWEMWCCSITEEQFKNMFEFITREEAYAVLDDRMDL